MYLHAFSLPQLGEFALSCAAYTTPNRKLHSSLNSSHVSDGLSHSNLRNHRASLSKWNDPNFLLVRCLLMAEEIFIVCKPAQWVGQPIISREVYSWVPWSPQKNFLSIFLLPVIVVMSLGATALFFTGEWLQSYWSHSEWEFLNSSPKFALLYIVLFLVFHVHFHKCF